MAISAVVKGLLDSLLGFFRDLISRWRTEKKAEEVTARRHEAAAKDHIADFEEDDDARDADTGSFPVKPGAPEMRPPGWKRGRK